MRDLPPLNALKAFEAAGRHLNFARAAEELGVTQGAVAQQVRALEAQLQVKLFDRHARGLHLTGAGRSYLPPLGRAFDLMAEATGALKPGEQAVTISATPSVATKWLVPRLGEFARAHPGIRLRLDASTALADFQSGGADIALRQGRPPFGPGLTADLLFGTDLIAVCHPAHAAGCTPISAPADLCRHVLLVDTHGLWPLFLEKAFGGAALPDLKTMTFSQTSLAIDAAAAGQGIALANRPLAEADLAAGRLCQVLPVSLPREEGVHIVAPREPRRLEMTAAVRGWLLAQR
ncbi:LysR substrate-binding domain-containing protein [Roseobacteraceae bacterium NS-SX3]